MTTHITTSINTTTGTIIVAKYAPAKNFSKNWFIYQSLMTSHQYTKIMFMSIVESCANKPNIHYKFTVHIELGKTCTNWHNIVRQTKSKTNFLAINYQIKLFLCFVHNPILIFCDEWQTDSLTNKQKSYVSYNFNCCIPIKGRLFYRTSTYKSHAESNSEILHYLPSLRAQI